MGVLRDDDDGGKKDSAVKNGNPVSFLKWNDVALTPSSVDRFSGA